jgi:hypothetical protein
MIVDLSCPRSFDLMALSLNVVIDLVKFSDEGIMFLLLLREVSLVGEDVRPTLALVFFFLVRGFLVPPPPTFSFRGGVATKWVLRFALVTMEMGEQVEDGCWLMVDDGHECWGWGSLGQSAFYLMTMVSQLRRCLRVVAHLLRHRFSALILEVAEHAGPPTPIVIDVSESTRQNSPVAVVRKSRDPNMMWVQSAKVSQLVNAED